MRNYSFRPDTPNKATIAGFSLIELMVSVAILAVLATLGGPSFVDALKRYKINALRDELIGSIQLARTEAIKRGTLVWLSRVNCSANASDSDDWSCGWEIVADSNASGTKTSSDLIVQTTTFPTGYALMHTGLGSSLQFNVWGQAQGVGQKFVLTPMEGVSGASTTTICINSGGRIRKLTGDATCP